MSHSGFGFVDFWNVFLTSDKNYFSQRIHLKITVLAVQFTGVFDYSES